MTWIRGPFWDGAWLLSALPIGAVLTLASLAVPGYLLTIWIIFAVQTGHTISPMIAAWGNDGFRALVLRHRIKFIAVPLGIIVVSLMVGYIGGRLLGNHEQFDPLNLALVVTPQMPTPMFHNPFIAMLAVYMVWNGWHFGRQNFGIMSLYRRKSGIGHRKVDLVYSCGVTWAAMLMPFVPGMLRETHLWWGWPRIAVHVVFSLKNGIGYQPYVPVIEWIEPIYLTIAGVSIAAMLLIELRRGFCLPRIILIVTQGAAMVGVWFFGLWGTALLGVNHWLAAIGVGAVVSGSARPGRIALLTCALGALIFAALFVRPTAWTALWQPGYLFHFAVMAVAFRLGLGFVHFLYDRQLYKLSNPAVRATIGASLFAKEMQYAAD